MTILTSVAPLSTRRAQERPQQRTFTRIPVSKSSSSAKCASSSSWPSIRKARSSLSRLRRTCFVISSWRSTDQCSCQKTLLQLWVTQTNVSTPSEDLLADQSLVISLQQGYNKYTAQSCMKRQGWTSKGSKQRWARALTQSCLRRPSLCFEPTSKFVKDFRHIQKTTTKSHKHSFY